MAQLLIDQPLDLFLSRNIIRESLILTSLMTAPEERTERCEAVHASRLEGRYGKKSPLR
jgi:hypothetical protein